MLECLFVLEPHNHLCHLGQEWIIRQKLFDLVDFSPSRMVAKLQDEGSFGWFQQQINKILFFQGQSNSRRTKGSMWERWIGGLDFQTITFGVKMWEFDKWYGFNFNILNKQKPMIVEGFSFWISFFVTKPSKWQSLKIREKVKNIQNLQILCSARWHGIRGLGEELLRWRLPKFVGCA